MQHITYPQLWKNKISGKKVICLPWWEIVKDGEIEKVDELGQLITEMAGRPCKFGVIVQIGYLIENSHGVWIGLAPVAAESFEDLGEYKSKS